MNSLEFINQNIFECKNHIEYLEIKIIEDKKYPSLVKPHKEQIENLKPILNHLQKIKRELIVIQILKDRLFDNERVELQKLWYDGEEEYHYFLVFTENYEIELVDENQYNAIKEWLEAK